MSQLPIFLWVEKNQSVRYASLLHNSPVECLQNLPLWNLQCGVECSPFPVCIFVGEKRFRFDPREDHIVLYHEQGAPSVFVGTVGRLHYYNFEDSTNFTVLIETNRALSKCKKQENAKNYLTLLEKYEDRLLVCGTNACSPTCWNLVDRKVERGISAQGLAPFAPDQNGLVLIDGKEIYSTIPKHQYNGRTLRFRRIRGSAVLFTSVTVMNNPKFVKAAIIKQEEAYNDKIYYFFREENPDWPKNAAAPRNVSRVAQLCKGDKGGTGSLSAAKWTTFLKATLLCVDSDTDRHFNQLQDVFIVESAKWSETRIYGLFLNEWEYSAVCVYSVGDINKVFQTSPLKDYHKKLPPVRPGQCLEGEQRTPQETFTVADSYPEVARRVKQEDILYHSKHRYQQIGVHRALAADGGTYSILYLATDRGTVHKVAVLPTGANNVLEIQPFLSPAAIRTMTLDSERKQLFVASGSEVVQLPMAMCGAYEHSCESCILARDPDCGWINGKCTSVYDHDQHGKGTLLQALTHNPVTNICSSPSHSTAKGDDSQHCENMPVAPGARYYLNCSIKSHHATYTWLHDNQAVAHCGSGHRHCIHFIESMTDELYGTYSCVSQEDWFNQTLVAECLTKPSKVRMQLKEPRNTMAKDRATQTYLSLWPGLLHMAAVILLTH
ncbi:semaphorin-7A isoform X1 [Zootoca vivipara]|uniref:semaphorin-7A isoform X1 n=1 Tax=Zootoca vivipara TaxID=8524 RepID=UPI00293BFCC0|nr:semaphorin-7A isoform X1 [Zootoca vivipara]